MKNTNFYFTVLLCTYNDGNFIKRTIQSVLEQSYQYFEFIIVNDGSTDNTLSIIQEFQDNRIVLIDNSKNLGLIRSLNLGISNSNYDWIMRIDGDDICYPNRLEVLIGNINTNYAVIGSQCDLIDSNGKAFGKTWLKETHNDILTRMKLLLPSIIHPSTIINKKYLNNIGGYDEYMLIAEDYDLWLRLSKLGQLKNINRALIKYRIHENNISNQKRSLQYLNTQVAYYKYKNNINLISNISEYNYIVNKIKSNIFFKISNFNISKIDSDCKIVSKIHMVITLLFSYLLRLTF